MRTEFTDFFAGQWDRMLRATEGATWEERAAALYESVMSYSEEGHAIWRQECDAVAIPAEYLNDATDPDPSWDRRAAWLVFAEMQQRGQLWTGPAQRDMFTE